MRALPRVERASSQAADHAPEDEAVDRVEGIPVRQARQALGLEERGLLEPAAVGGWRDVVLKPRSAGDAHLGAKAKQGWTLDGLHAPEVEGIADPQVVWGPASQAHADAAHQAIEHAAHAPEEIRVGPAGATAEPLDFREQAVGRHANHGPASLDDHA